MIRWMKLLGSAVVVSLGIPGMAQEAATQPAPAPLAAESHRPPEIAADQTTPKGTMKLHYLATRSGDGEKLHSLMYTQTPQEKEFVDARIGLMRAERALAQVASVRFGRGIDQYLRLPATMPADTAGLFVDPILASLTEEVGGRELAAALVGAPGDDAGIFVTNLGGSGWASYQSLVASRSDLIMIQLDGASTAAPQSTTR